MSIEVALEELNARLKAGRHKCSVEQRKASLVLRATLVDRDDPTSHRRQRISLDLPAVYGSLPEAELKALELAHQLRTGTFTWELWDAPPTPTLAAPGLTVDDFRAAAKTLHASKYRKDPERGRNAWTKKWAPALNKLPLSGPLTEDVLLRIIRRMPEGTAGRRDQGNLLCQVAKSLGLPIDTLHEASRGYGTAKLTPRDIPSDELIQQSYRRIPQPHWRWAWGMCATFGLRPHELSDLELHEDGRVTVADRTKTGSRLIWPCPSDWLTRFELLKLPRPTQSASTIAKVFGDALERSHVTIKPYNLRHAYALRLLSSGVPPEIGARLMGHSVSMHTQTYQRWLDRDRIAKAMERFSL